MPASNSPRSNTPSRLMSSLSNNGCSFTAAPSPPTAPSPIPDKCALSDIPAANGAPVENCPRGLEGVIGVYRSDASARFWKASVHHCIPALISSWKTRRSRRSLEMSVVMSAMRCCKIAVKSCNTTQPSAPATLFGPSGAFAQDRCS